MRPDAEDKAAIFARRAALVAGALASVTAGQRAEARPEEKPAIATDCPRREPSPEEVDEARRLASEAEDLALLGAPHAAPLERAYLLAPGPGLAMLVARAHEAAGLIDAAHAALTLEIACGGPAPELERKRNELERNNGRIRIVSREPHGLEGVEMEGRVTRVDRATDGIAVPPGARTLRVALSDGRVEVRQLRVEAGTTTVLEVGGPPPMPCLSLLPPDPDPPREGTYALELGFVPVISVSGGGPWITEGGGGLRLGIAARVAEDVWFTADLAWVITAGEVVSATAGTVAELTWYPNRIIGFGAGFSGAVGERPVPGAKDTADAPQAGLFGPVAIPLSVLAGEYAKLELRVPFYFGAVFAGEPRHDLRFEQIMPQLTASIVLSERILGRAF